MSIAKKIFADLLFGVQIAGGLLLTTTQVVRSFHSTEGLSFSMFSLTAAFMFLNFTLAVKAHQAQPSRITHQTIFIYGLWVVLLLSITVVVFINNPTIWEKNDTLIFIAVGCGAAIVLGISRLRDVPIADPRTRAALAIIFKTFPQFAQAQKIFVMGGGGIAGGAILGGHITIITRLVQLVFSIKEAGWDKNRIASAVSEVGNWLSWLAVTIAWFIV